MSVVALPGFSVPGDNEPVERVVEILTEALELAKRGEVIGVAVVAVYRQPLAFGTDYHAEHTSRHSLGAGVLALGYQFAKAMIDG